MAIAVDTVGSITHGRWQEAQGAERQYWSAVDGAELLRICAEKPAFLGGLPANVVKDLFHNRDVLDIGVGPLGISLASFYRNKRAIKRLTKIEPLPRLAIRNDILATEEWSHDIAEWAAGLSEEGEYIQGSGENLEKYRASFDTIVTYNVLDHVMAPKRILSSAMSALRPGGRLLVSVDCLSVLGRLKFECYVRRAFPDSILTQAHPHTFLVRDVCRMINEAGFEYLTVFGAPSLVTKLVGSHTRPAFVASKPSA